MEDSTAMTIEFLRARLLSERSVSRTAKQRADELAKRVVELEEQLKFVIRQRKKAEKATAEVLAILENSGIDDFSEAFDSNSDQEGVPCDSKEDNKTMKEEGSSVTSRRSKNEAEEMSASELEGSLLYSRSLSWKGCSDTPSLEKNKDIYQSRRKECNFVSTCGSSTKPLLGQSCRQIRRRETISAANEVGYESFLFDAQVDGGTSGLGDDSGNLKDRLKNMIEGAENEEKVFPEGPGSPKDLQRKSSVPFDVNGNKIHANMERAVENQAQFIDQNIAQENAQREWEENFKENNSCTRDSSEHGNRSDITEERDDIKITSECADIVPSHGQGTKSEAEESSLIGETMTKVLPNCSLSTCLDMVCSQDQHHKGTSNGGGSSFSEFSFPSQEAPGSTAKGKEKQDWPDTLSCGLFDKSSAKTCSLQVDGSQAENQNELQIAVWQEAPKDSGAVLEQEAPKNSGAVLEELQRVKLSLKRELNRLPSSMQARPVARKTENPLPVIEAGDSMKIPNVYGGLFRVPTDFSPFSNTELNLTRYSKNTESIGSDQYTSHNLETGLRDSFQRQYFDPYMDMGMVLPVASRYINPSYADSMMPRMTSSDGGPRPYPSFRPEMPATDRCSLYNEPVRFNMPRKY